MVSERVRDEILKVTDEVSKTEPRFYKDLEPLRVELVSYTKNPYKPMVEMALMTWGEKGKKWELLSPETRFYVVKQVLQRKALPLALEAPKFNFYVEGVTRACFDQIARARIGVVFAAKGFKDNNLTHVDFIVPHIFDDEDAKKVEELYKNIKSLYDYLRKRYPGWAARYIMPMGTKYNFFMSIDYAALQQLCANRMETTEQVDTVALAWMLREKVKEKFPLLAEYLRPQCDWARRDRTLEVNGFSEILGVPHVSDGRWPGFDKTKVKYEWDVPCTDIRYIEKVLGIKIPGPQDWKDYTWETLDERDRRLFEED